MVCGVSEYNDQLLHVILALCTFIIMLERDWTLQAVSTLPNNQIKTRVVLIDQNDRGGCNLHEEDRSSRTRCPLPSFCGTIIKILESLFTSLFLFLPQCENWNDLDIYNAVTETWNICRIRFHQVGF